MLAILTKNIGIIYLPTELLVLFEMCSLGLVWYAHGGGVQSMSHPYKAMPWFLTAEILWGCQPLCSMVPTTLEYTLYYLKILNTVGYHLLWWNAGF